MVNKNKIIMLKILVNSYTCCPNMGSEQGMGWNWIVSLARYCVMYVITEGEYRGEIEAWMRDADNADVAKNIHFYYLPIGGDDEAECDKIRKMCWNQGDWRFYKYYKEWQKKVADKAKSIINDEERKVLSGETDHGIDVLHQLNMIGFREPGFLWKVSEETEIPFVWGPADAKEKFPVQYAIDAGIKTKAFLRLKNAITAWQLKHDKRVHAAARQANIILAASSNSVESFQKYMNKESVLMNETGCAMVNRISKENESNVRLQKFDILWVGKMDFRKQLGVALKTVAVIPNDNICLHIIGGGDVSQYKFLAKSLGIEDRIVWHGVVSHYEVQSLMHKAHVLLFTSVAEGTPHVVLEAFANGLPVVCHDTCGQGDSVNDKVGIKIPLSNPEQSVKDFASAIESLYNDRERLKQMSDNCYVHAEELSWDNKAKQMVHLYEEAIKKNMRN